MIQDYHGENRLPEITGIPEMVSVIDDEWEKAVIEIEETKEIEEEVQIEEEQKMTKENEIDITTDDEDYLLQQLIHSPNQI